MAISNGPAQGIELAQPIAEIEKHQPVPMPAPAPSMAPGPAERERGNEPSREMRTEPVPSRANEGAVSEKGAEPTPIDDQPADDSHGDQADAMDVDHDREIDREDRDQDKAQLEGEKSTLREATPDHIDNERNTSRKAFSERPSRALLEGETRETLREATPGQPRDEDSYDERSHRQEIGSLSRPPRPEPEDGGQRRSNKVDERPDKVAPQTVNEDEERPDVRRSS